MLVHRDIQLRSSDGKGIVEVRVSHNTAPGAAEAAGRTWKIVRDAILDAIEGIERTQGENTIRITVAGVLSPSEPTEGG